MSLASVSILEQRADDAIHRGYERLIRSASEHDAIYLRGRLQEARWLLKSLEARGDTLLKVMRCLLRQQSAFLEFGDQASAYAGEADAALTARR